MESGATVNILIPMAGRGSRFASVGFEKPKPLIDVNGRPMIAHVIDNMAIPGARYIFVIQKSHDEQFGLSDMLCTMTNGACRVVTIDGITEGAACTCLVAKELIDTATPLIIANSDQFLEWDANIFFQQAIEKGVFGSISTFQSTSPKWSFVRLNDRGFVAELKEKVPISDIATTGIYFWARGCDFVRDAERMVAADDRSNNEFYVAPVYNYAIARGENVSVCRAKRMWGLGVPEDLAIFLEHHH